MTLFESFLELQLGPTSSVSVSRSANGLPTVQVSLDGVPLAGSIELEPGCLVLDGELDEEVEAAILQALAPHGHRLRRIHDFLDRFPASVQRGDTVALVSLEMPRSRPLWSDDGLCAAVIVSTLVDGKPSGIMELEMVIATRAALDADPWEERLAAFDARRAQWAERFPDLSEIPPQEACLEIAKPPVVEDEGWTAYAERLGLDAEALAPRVAPIVAIAFETIAAVRARYHDIYGLKLPSGIAGLAALVTALGELPENPEELHWDPAPGVQRGNAWLDRALGMRTSGLTEWFAPGGLARRTRDASALHEVVPAGCEGRLDPRLDGRFRRDAPQFVTFLGGDSDGLHWGFWYDSPDHFPVIAANYARDDAETWLEDGATIGPWLRARIAKGFEEARRELIAAPDDEYRGYALRRWRALRVIEAHLSVIEQEVATRVEDDEPLCPWPRTHGRPVGSPPLALPPGAGTVPADVPRLWTGSDGVPSVEQRRASIEEARRELAAGRPAHAHALGLYLHWLDGDELRDEADPVWHGSPPRWRDAAAWSVERAVTIGDLALVLLACSERDAVTPASGKALDEGRWTERRERASAVIASAATNGDLALEIAAPWSYRWATWLTSHPGAVLTRAHLLAALDGDRLWAFCETQDHSDGLETIDESVGLGTAVRVLLLPQARRASGRQISLGDTPAMRLKARLNDASAS